MTNTVFSTKHIRKMIDVITAKMYITTSIDEYFFMEIFIVRLIKLIITAFLVLLPTSLGTVNAKQVDSTDIPADLSAYYGFGEIEIIKMDWGIKDLKTTDFNGDGRNDIAVVNNLKAKIEILIQKETIGQDETSVSVDPNDIDVNVIIPPSRFNKQSVPVSQRMYSFDCGDLNSDGMVDLAFYGEPKGLYVMLQKVGEIEASKVKSLSWQTRKKISIENGLSTAGALVCADLNNDGANDLALAGTDGIYIILQKTDGSLAEPVKYPTTALTLGIKVGDLNGDRINDLILITNDNEKPVHVRFGLETGQLGPQIEYFIERPILFELYNLDGIIGDEILTIDSISKRLICYKLAAQDQKNTDWPILFYPLAAGEDSTKRDLAAGDFDGDGLMDITISDPGAAELIFYKQIAGVGLAEPVRYPAFSDIVCLSAADIEGDKKSEIAVLSVKEKVIGISKYKDDRLSFPKPIELVGEPLAMELADIDGDGNSDCVYISKNDKDARYLRILYNLAAATEQKTDDGEQPVRRSLGEVGRTENLSSVIRHPNTVLELTKLTANPDALKVLDVDQDGLQDVLIFVSYELPILVRQVRKPVPSEAEGMEFEIVDSPKMQASLIKDARLNSIAIANVDGKPGDELLLAQKNFARSLVFAEGQSWNVIDQYNAKSTENQISAVAAFDIDGRGTEAKPEILLLDGLKGYLQILRAGDDKTYRFEKELDVGRWDNAAHLKMLFAPLTGSGNKNILLFDGSKLALITPPTESNMQTHLVQQFSYETKIKDGLYGNLTAGDINSDGRTDIIMVEYNRNHIEILSLDNDIKPVPAMRFKIFEQKSYRDSKLSSEFSVEPRDLSVADVTGDGKNDLVTVIHDRIIIYPQD